MPSHAPEDQRAVLSRRALLAAAASSAAAGAAGIALGYRYRAELRALKLEAGARPLSMPAGMSTFRQDAEGILERHDRQTVEDVAALKHKYEDAVFGKVNIWDLVQQLAYCIDASDMRLFCASQLVHCQQV